MTLSGMFASHAPLRAVVDAVLEGRLGHATLDGGAARLSLGCYEVFGGDAAAPGSRALVEGAARPRELVFGNDPEWRHLIAEVHEERVSDRPMREFDPAGLDRAALRRLRSDLTADISLRRLDPHLAAQLDTELEPHGLQSFESIEDFAERGVGFGAVAGGRLVSAATSYTVSSRFLEVAIATRPDFRGRGLAAAAGAALVLHSLEAGLAPRWSASNPVSQRLAARLGFRPAGLCEVLYLR